jgi:predicted Zn-dependent peptidase
MSQPNTIRDVQTTVLPNGLRIITETMTHVRSVSVGLWISSGSRTEQGPENGLSHLIEHMVFKGTASRSAEDIARSMDSLGGNLDAFTGKELVSFNAKILDEHLPIAFDILSDMVLRPAFREDDINKEKGVILEELKMEADSPEYVVHETFLGSFWKDHPLGKPILGTRETIRGFDREMVDKYYHSVYTPAQIVITAAGNLTHQQMVDLASAQFGSLPPGPPARDQQAPKAFSKIILKEKKSLEQVHLMMGVPAYAVPHERRFAAYVLNTLLGGSMSSRLFQNIREQRGLVYSVFSEVNAYRDSGCMAIYAGMSRSSAREVIALILAELRDLKDNLVKPEELERSKDHLKGSVILGLESTSSRMSNLARQFLYFNRFFTMDEIIEEIDRVTDEAVQQVARDFFAPERIAVTMLGRLNGWKLDRKDLVC